MSTNREDALKILDVLRDYIKQTGQDKYLHLDNPEPHDIIIGAGMGVGYFWGEMYKRMHEIAVKYRNLEPIQEDLLKILHEGVCLLAHRHPELINKPNIIHAPPGKEEVAKKLIENYQRKENTNEPIKNPYPTVILEPR